MDAGEWLAFKTKKGYGQFHLSGGKKFTHTYFYEKIKGPILNSLLPDHLCRNRSCCNPNHLEPVTNLENVLRGIGPTAINKRKTHCLKGHEFTKENTYEPPHRLGRRECRKCKKGYY